MIKTNLIVNAYNFYHSKELLIRLFMKLVRVNPNA